jgi:hypothetical protein
MIKCEAKKLFLPAINNAGEMSEWSNEPAWKAGVLATVPRVRIPLSPPQSKFFIYLKPVK